MKEKLEIKQLEQKPAAGNEAEINPVRSRARAEGTSPEDRGTATSNGIETWEGEGGTVETQAAEGEPRPEGREESSTEVPETIVEEPRVERSWREILIQAKEEFPEEIKEIVEKSQRGEKLKTGDFNRLDAFSQRWFRETFGVALKKKQPISKEPLPKEEVARRKKQSKEAEEKNRKKKKQPQLQELAKQKNNKMKQLHNALINLDAGESVEEFIDETRRVVYFDDENQQYFVEESGERKNIGIGDIVSDYAWGIKYFPDSRMADATAYRTLAKRVLVNETRRDIEKIHNSELIILRPYRASADSFARIWPRVKEAFEKTGTGVAKQQLIEKLLGDVEGWIIEVAVRELVSRLSLNTKLDFVVSRATVEEDADYKYDFKVRVKRRLRGVDVQSKNISSAGFQLKSEFNRMGAGLSSRQTKKGVTKVVDEILTLKVPSKDFRKAVKKWFEVGEPSGGPEQFLPKDLKVAILKAVTEKLIDVPQEVFDKIK